MFYRLKRNRFERRRFLDGHETYFCCCQIRVHLGSVYIGRGFGYEIGLIFVGCIVQVCYGWRIERQAGVEIRPGNVRAKEIGQASGLDFFAWSSE